MMRRYTHVLHASNAPTSHQSSRFLETLAKSPAVYSAMKEYNSDERVRLSTTNKGKRMGGGSLEARSGASPCATTASVSPDTASFFEGILVTAQMILKEENICKACW